MAALWVLSLLLMWGEADGGKILVTHSLIGRSHIFQMEKLAHILATDGGHQVTFLKSSMVHDYRTATSNHSSVANLRVVEVEDEAAQAVYANLIGDVHSHADDSSYGAWNKTLMSVSDAFKLVRVAQVACHSFLKQTHMWAQLAQEDFDLVLMDDPSLSQCLHRYVGRHIKAPRVAYGMWEPGMAGVAKSLFQSSTGEMFINLLGADMSRPNLVNRAKNVVNFWFETYLAPYVMVELPSLHTLCQYMGDCLHTDYSFSLMFVNTHWVLEPARPTLPNVVMLGGILCEEPKPLPEEVRRMVADDGRTGSAGVIYISFGTFVTEKMLGRNIISLFLDVFDMIPEYRVLWQISFSRPTWRHVPKNVKFCTWVPQQDILGHNRTKVFISHGGFKGVMETIYHRKPALLFPMLGNTLLYLQSAH